MKFIQTKNKKMETQTYEKQQTRKVDKPAFNHSGIKPVFNLLKYTFVIVPIVAGIDKFTDLLVNWDKYLHPGLTALLPFPVHTFMMVAGIIEVIAGIVVFLRPAIGGLIVAAWLTLIALTLLASGNYLDVAVRDLVMAISAYSMTQLAKRIS
jgi:uncharacterized membrane protein YphA (DoxX/SURF4 family)